MFIIFWKMIRDNKWGTKWIFFYLQILSKIAYRSRYKAVLGSQLVLVRYSNRVPP
jgi:hypothetical protein